jgi:hypothetical protein
MDDQSVLNLKGDFNTEGTEDTEKTGKRKKGERLSQRVGETQRAQRRKSGFLAKDHRGRMKVGGASPSPTVAG